MRYKLWKIQFHIYYFFPIIMNHTCYIVYQQAKAEKKSEAQRQKQLEKDSKLERKKNTKTKLFDIKSSKSGLKIKIKTKGKTQGDKRQGDKTQGFFF